MPLRAFTLACSTPWAITPEALQHILEISAREHIPDFEAVQAKRGRRLDSAEGVKMREGGVAVISITGPIFRYANLFTEFSGGATIDSLAKDFNSALNDPNVSSILLNIDSPGGQVAGTNEFAQMVFDARGRKPIVAYVDSLSASAGYWIASAAHEIVTDATGVLGSIGVVATVPNPQAKSAKDIQIVSSQSPRKRPDPTTETGKAQIQHEIDDLADVFVGAVARNRGVSVETVLDSFGQGDVFVGRKAVEAGMADRLGSFEEVVADLAAGKKPRRYKPKTAAEAAEEEDMTLSERFKNLKARMIAAIDADENPPQEILGKVETTEPAKITADFLPLAEEREARAKVDAENAELRKQIAAQREEKTKADAEAFVTAQVVAGRLFPAEKDPTVTQYLIAAADDDAHPRTEGSRVASLRKMIESRPSNRLTEELTVGKTDKVLKSDENSQTEMSEQRRAQLLNATPAGKAALSVVK